MSNPTLLTFIFSQVFGMYLLILAIIFAGRAHHYRALIQSIDPNGPGLFLGSVLGLLAGLFLVTIHNFWGALFVDVLTLFFWFILILSIVALSFPTRFVKCLQKVYSGSGYYVMFILSGMLGILLMTGGYYLYM